MGFISAPGPLEIMVILALALIVLGPSRLPDAARSIGRGVREFRDSLSSLGDDSDDADYGDPQGRLDDDEADDGDDDDPDEPGIDADAAGGGADRPAKDS